MASSPTLNEGEVPEAAESAAKRPGDVRPSPLATVPSKLTVKLTLPDVGQRAPSPPNSRPPTSAEIDRVIAAAMANAPPAPLPMEPYFDGQPLQIRHRYSRS